MDWIGLAWLGFDFGLGLDLDFGFWTVDFDFGLGFWTGILDLVCSSSCATRDVRHAWWSEKEAAHFSGSGERYYGQLDSEETVC